MIPNTETTDTLLFAAAYARSVLKLCMLITSDCWCLVQYMARNSYQYHTITNNNYNNNTNKHIPNNNSLSKNDNTGIWVVVKVMVPFWALSVVRHLVFRGRSRGRQF